MKRIKAVFLALVAALALGIAAVPLSARAEDPVTVNMNVRSLGHGTVKVNDIDYGAEFQGTWPEGTEVQIEAVPDAGYKLDEWWIKSTPSNRYATTAQTTLEAGTDTEAVAVFCLETAYVAITPPAAGTTAATAPQVSMPSGAGYVLDTNQDLHGLNAKWVNSDSMYPYPETLDSSTVFEAGQTYYAYVRLAEGTDSFAARAGGSNFDTDLQVTGGTKTAQGNFAAVTSGSVGYMGIEAIIAVTVPETATETCEVAATGHDWGERHVTKEPTVDAEGEEGRTCKRCGEVETRAIPKIATYTITLTTDGNGKAELKGGGTSATLPAGSDVEVVLTPNDGYALVDFVVVNGPEQQMLWNWDDDPVVVVSFGMPEGDIELKATFASAVTIAFDINGGTPGPSWPGSVAVPGSEPFTVDAMPEGAAVPPVGYEFAGIELPDGTLVAVGESFTPTEDMTVKLVWKEVAATYSFVAGDGFSYTLGTDAALAFIVKRSVNDSVTFSRAKAVLVDGVELGEGQCELAEGSLVITLKNGYLETLSVGEHTITAQFEDGEATATFMVKAGEAPEPAPEPEPVPEPEPEPEPEPAPAPKPTPEPETDPAPKPKPSSPATGEPASIASFLAAIGGALIVASRRKKR